MGLINPTLPTVGQPNSTEDVDVLNALIVIRDAINGGLDSANLAAAAGITADQLAAAVAAAAGLSQTGAVRRGKSIIATEESRTNTAYGLLTTPDQVQNIVLPTDGLIFIGYQALAKTSVSASGKAALFLDANQIKGHQTGNAAPIVQEANIGTSNANTYHPVSSYPLGLVGYADSVGHTSDVTTGQVLCANVAADFSGATYGGVCILFAAAGTYDLSVQWKASSGSITAKERKLWAWALGF